MRERLSQATKTAANVAWNAFQAVNTRIPDSPSVHPDWAPAPLPKSYERTKPPLGWPRETDSLCPDCVIEVRDAIIAGERDISEFTDKKSGEIKAEIVEEDGKILIKKRCEIHGEFVDTLSVDPKLSGLLERRYFGRDFRTAEDEHLHHHGSSTIRYGRGAVLTIDLTNRCNMMCNPCFMDANQVGYVHELTLEEIKEILDDSISFKPRRQMSVQFSGGEPTMSPHFLEACAYAREVGYYSVQAATNGLRFALEPEFAYQSAEAGLNMVYLQFDGVTNESNMHRHISNLFDAKWMAIDRLYNAGIDITPVTTVINTVNNEQVGPLLEFVIQNSDKMGAISFQPVSFTGRDEEISDEDRHKQRYTISHLARDLQEYTGGKVDMYRDWYPLGAAGAYTWLADHLRGDEVEFGGISCSCHPNCGASLMLVVNSRTKEWSPLTQFFDSEAFINDIERDHGHIAREEAQPLPDGARPDAAHRRVEDARGADPEDLPRDGQHEARWSRNGRRQQTGVEDRVGRRDVVPGSLDLRFPAHRDVRDSLRHPGGRDLLLRLQHGRRLAQHRREHAHGRRDEGLVQGTRPS